MGDRNRRKSINGKRICVLLLLSILLLWCRYLFSNLRVNNLSQGTSSVVFRQTSINSKAKLDNTAAAKPDNTADSNGQLQPQNRIAIALSGDPRGFRQTHHSIYRNLVQCNPAYQFEGFVVFGFKGRPFRPYRGGIANESDYVEQSKELVEVYQQFFHIARIEYRKHGQQLERVMQAHHIVRQHELAENFRYDLVIRIRFDMFLAEPLVLDRLPACTSCIHSRAQRRGKPSTDFNVMERKLHGNGVYSLTHAQVYFPNNGFYAVDSIANERMASYHVIEPNLVIQHNGTASQSSPEAMLVSVLVANDIADQQFDVQEVAKGFCVTWFGRGKDEVSAFLGGNCQEVLRLRFLADLTFHYDELQKCGYMYKAG